MIVSFYLNCFDIEALTPWTTCFDFEVIPARAVIRVALLRIRSV